MTQKNNIKISSVVFNLFGNTGRNLMNKLIDTDIEITIGHVEAFAEGSLKQKSPITIMGNRLSILVKRILCQRAKEKG